MDKFVSLVYFEYECVVDLVGSENLNTDSSRKYDVNNNSSANVNRYATPNFSNPIRPLAVT